MRISMTSAHNTQLQGTVTRRRGETQRAATELRR
jgi:hypothetical protein